MLYGILRFELKKQRRALSDLVLTCSVQERFGESNKPRSFIEDTRSITRLLRYYSCGVLQISFVLIWMDYKTIFDRLLINVINIIVKVDRR